MTARLSVGGSLISPEWQCELQVIWCENNPDHAALDKNIPEECGLFSELVRGDVPGVPPSERGAERTTLLSADTHSVIVNFRDLDAAGAAAEIRE